MKKNMSRKLCAGASRRKLLWLKRKLNIIWACSLCSLSKIWAQVCWKIEERLVNKGVLKGKILMLLLITKSFFLVSNKIILSMLLLQCFFVYTLIMSRRTKFFWIYENEFLRFFTLLYWLLFKLNLTSEKLNKKFLPEPEKINKTYLDYRVLTSKLIKKA